MQLLSVLVSVRLGHLHSWLWNLPAFRSNRAIRLRSRAALRWDSEWLRRCGRVRQWTEEGCSAHHPIGASFFYFFKRNHTFLDKLACGLCLCFSTAQKADAISCITTITWHLWKIDAKNVELFQWLLHDWLVFQVESLQSSSALPASNRIPDQSLSLPTSDSRCDGAAEGATLPIGKCLSTYVLCTNRTAYTKKCQSSTGSFVSTFVVVVLKLFEPIDNCIINEWFVFSKREIPFH